MASFCALAKVAGTVVGVVAVLDVVLLVSGSLWLRPHLVVDHVWYGGSSGTDVLKH